ncbi:MAG: HEAT repeat domain-containing protein [Planctomycetota bacterium]
MLRLLLLLFSLSLFSLSAGDENVDEMIAEFKRFYRGRASVAEKIEAIHVLDRSDTKEAVEALVACFDDPDFSVRQAAVEVLGGFRNPECAQYLIDNIVANKHVRKTAHKIVAVEALSRMGHSDAVEPITDLLREKDADLLRACCMALGRLQATGAVEGIVKLLESGEPTVQIAAIDALGEIRDPSANAAVLARLEDRKWQVRVAVVGALAKLRQKESVQPLIDLLRTEKGRLIDDTLATLVSLTTFDLGNHPDKWQEVWDRVKDRFEVPSEADIQKARENFEKALLRYTPGTDDFAGIPTRSKRILYVIDISGSMEDPLLDREKFVLEGRTYSAFIKIEVVKHELVRTLENLDDTVFFNVIAFATQVKPWKKRGLVQANILNRKAAADWVSRLQAIGGQSQSLKRQAGLSLSAGGGMGKTNTYDVLMTALDAKAADSGYDTDLGSPVDTIFFLSDGDPTAGPITEIDRILLEVRRVNALRKIKIHTINIGKNTRGKLMMRDLARQNDGVFLDLGE